MKPIHIIRLKNFTLFTVFSWFVSSFIKFQQCEFNVKARWRAKKAHGIGFRLFAHAAIISLGSKGVEHNITKSLFVKN
jgi:hypothetical protein